MKVYTDSPDFADRILAGVRWRRHDCSAADADVRRLIERVFGEKTLFEAEVQVAQRWRYLLLAESSSRSQYDLLIEQRREGYGIPDGVLCLSGSGKGLHGLRQRPWAAEAGNIHLSVFLLPPGSVTASGIPFMVLAAVSVLDAIDSVRGLESIPGIKWVNDILLGGAKVAGVLAYTEGAGKAVDAAVLGIGLNVETTPDVVGTPFVPSVCSLRDFALDSDECTQSTVFCALLAALDENYQLLLDGRSGELLDRYRERSIVLQQQVTVYVDDTSTTPTIIARGTVAGIGDNLELLLAEGGKPVTRGRLVLESKI